MSEEEKKKMVHYHRYCIECEHWDTDETEDPCHECLNQPFNYNSHKPTKFKDKKKS